MVGVVGLHVGWTRRQVVAAHVGCDDAKARVCEWLDLQPPAEPELREAVQQNDQRPFAHLDVVQAHVAEVGVALTKLCPVQIHVCEALWRSRPVNCRHGRFPAPANWGGSGEYRYSREPGWFGGCRGTRNVAPPGTRCD